MASLLKEMLKRVPGLKPIYRRWVRFSASRVRPRINALMIRKVLRVSKELPEQQLYFSVYEIWPLAPARWLRNEQPWFRERLKNSECDDALVHFLGAPLVERDGIAESDYVGWLRNLIAHYEGKRFVYILHPRESNEWGNKLSTMLHIPVLRQKLPYEIELCMMSKRPRVVASWFCSALDNLGNCAIPSLDLVAFRLPRVRLAADKQRQGKILEAAELFYRRHEQGDRVSVLPIPGAKAQLHSKRPSASRLQEFAAELPLVMIEIRAFANGRVLLGQAQAGVDKGRLVLPCDLWLKGDTIDQAAFRQAWALLGEALEDGALVQQDVVVREVAMPDGENQHWLVYGFEAVVSEPVRVVRQLTYDHFEWWEPKVALATPMLGAQTRRQLDDYEQRLAASR